MRTDHVAQTLTLTLGATIMTWLPLLDMWLRIGASLVAIVSGLICTVIAIKRYRRLS